MGHLVRVGVAMCPLGLALVFTAHCTSLGGLSGGGEVDPADAGDAASPSEAGPPSDPCLHARPPPSPLVDDAPNDKLPAVYLAVRKMDVIARNGAPDIGLDLDGVCTCDPRSNTAFEGGVSCGTPRPPACDSDGGIDNALGRTLGELQGIIDVDQAVGLNKRISLGEQTVVLLLSSYNGRANDKEVGVGIFTSEGIRAQSPCAGSVASTPGFFTPGWCGEDVWTASAATVNAAPGGKFVPKAVGNGYVSNYELVASLGGSAPLPFGGVRLSVMSSILKGRLVPLDANGNILDTSTKPDPASIKRWNLADATVAGRVLASDLVAAMGTFTLPNGSGSAAYCMSGIFPALKGQICGAIDISGSAQLDFVDGVSCDSLSMAVAMNAEQANVSGVADGDAGINDCYPIADGGGPVNGGVTYYCP